MTLVLTLDIGELGGEGPDELESKLPTDEEQPSRGEIGGTDVVDILFWQL